jgi:NADH-quinone oxidoreductase subunit H
MSTQVISIIAMVLPFLKAFFVVMFSMNVAVILTWVDRRQGAMIQDRIGPDRAVVWLPRRVAQALAVLPALGAAGAVFGLGWQDKMERGGEAVDLGRALVSSQLAVFATWFTALVIAGAVRRRGPRNSFDRFLASLGDPRKLFYGGLALHLGIFVLCSLVRNTPAAETVRAALNGGGTLLLIAAIVGGAAYAALQMTEPRVGLRLIGLLHPAADGLKTAFKEDIVPPGVDKLMHGVAPFISFFPALVVLAVIPFADTLCVGTTDGVADVTKVLSSVPREGLCSEGAINFQVIDLNVGILYFFAVAGTGIVGAALGGWASNNKYSLLGGLRAASQMVSYEVTLGLTLIGAIMIYGTLQVDDMVRWQAQNTWGVFVQPIAFVLFFAAAVAESKRIPFDIPEGESEVVAGYFTEYAGMKFAMFFFAEYIAVVSSSAVMAAIFLGGWSLPFVHRDGIDIAVGGISLYSQQLSHGFLVLIGFLAFVGKVLMLCWLQLTIRWTLPRFRYDQLMKLGWRMLLPASLINILATGLVVLLVQESSEAVQQGLVKIAELTQAVVALSGLVAGVAFVLFILSPARHQRVLSTTSAQFAAEGTRRYPMGA